MRAQGTKSSVLSSMIVIASIAVISLAVMAVLRQHFEFTTLGAALPALICFAGLLLIQRIAQRAALVSTLAANISRLEAELGELEPGGRALEEASEDLARATQTLRGVDMPELAHDEYAFDQGDPSPTPPRPPGTRSERDTVAADPFGRRARAAGFSSETGVPLADTRAPAARTTSQPVQRPAAAFDPARLDTGGSGAGGLGATAVGGVGRPVATVSAPAHSSSSRAPHAPAAELASALTAIDPQVDTSANTSIDPQLADVLRRVAMDGSVEIFLQPIVALADRKPRLYDVFPRLRRPDGTRITPAEYWAPAHQLGVALVIERHVVVRASQVLQRLGERGRVRSLLCRLSMAGLADRGLITGLVSNLRVGKDLLEHLVIEISARDYFRNHGPERDGIEALGRHGVRFTLEGAETLVVDRHRLTADRVQFLKLSPQALAAEHQVAGYDGVASLITDLRRAGIDVIVDQVTDEGMAMHALDCSVLLGQGSIFGEARPIAAEYLGEVQTRAAVANLG